MENTLVIKDIHDIELSKDIINRYELESCVFIDIECTGFNKEVDSIFSITIGKFIEGRYVSTLMLNMDDEELLLSETYDMMKEKHLCTFNGIAFDEPFLNKRLKLYGMDELIYERHYDLYRMLCPYTCNLGAEGSSLKNYERLIGIDRIDIISGKECAELARLYKETGDNGIIKIMSVHNKEDVLSLPNLFNIVYNIENKKICRDDMIGYKEFTFIKRIIRNRRISADMIDRRMLSKKHGRKLIFELKKQYTSSDKINDIINDIKKTNCIFK